MAYSLGTAAKATGTSKATIHRAIKSGKISAARQDDGSYQIDPAELHRVFPPVATETGETGSANGSARQSETPAGTPETPDQELALANARLETELSGLRELLAVHRDQVADLRTERDRLLGQVEAAHRLLTHHQQAVIPPETPQAERRSWWRRLAG